ncbi:hypothetical protein ACROYT_G039742 [Oculina patagonica]
MEDLEDDPAKQTASNFDNTCRCCNKTVLLRNHPVHDIFGEKSNKAPELLKVLEFLTRKEVKSDDGFPNKLCQPRCFRKVKTVIEFHSLSLASLSKQELSIKEQFLRDIDSPCHKLCLTKKATPSVLNATQDSCVEALNHFSWEKVMVEMRDRSPDVLDVLATISKQPYQMYQRNSKLGMLQKLLSILLGSGGYIRRIFTCLNAIGVNQSQKTWVRAMDQIGSGLVSKVQKLVQEGL